MLSNEEIIAALNENILNTKKVDPLGARYRVDKIEFI